MTTHSERRDRRQNTRPVSPLLDMTGPLIHATDAIQRMRNLDGLRLQDAEERTSADARTRAAEINRELDFLATELDAAAAGVRLLKWASKGFFPTADRFAS